MSGKKRVEKQEVKQAAGAEPSGVEPASANGSSGRSGATYPEWKPNVEFFTSLSNDGRFVICKTVITAIKPIRYFEKVLSGKSSPVGDKAAPSTSSSPEKAG